MEERRRADSLYGREPIKERTKMRQVRWRETHGHQPLTRQYPTGVKLLWVASTVVGVCGLGGALYGLYLGIPIPDQNRFVTPTLLVASTLLMAALAWMWRLDASTGSP